MSAAAIARPNAAAACRDGAAAVLALALVVPGAAHAYHTNLIIPIWESQVFCDMPTLTGEFHRDKSTYRSSGTCVELMAKQPQPDGARNRSEFPQFNDSTEFWRAGWTAQGGYDPVTKEAWEAITLLPSPKEERSPHRPVGRFVARMVCVADPWLHSSAGCLNISTEASGNLLPLEAFLRSGKRPMTSTQKESMRNRLIEQHARVMRQLDLRPTTATARTGPAIEALTADTPPARIAPNEAAPASKGAIGALTTRANAVTPQTAKQPAAAAASAPYGKRPPNVEWGRAAPSALGSR